MRTIFAAMNALEAARWLVLTGPLRMRLSLLSALLPFLVSAQTQVAQDGARIEILGADAWTFDAATAGGAQRLIGHARFKHAGATMSCDSAYIFEDQRVQAYGHVSIRQGDTLTIVGDRLEYAGKERLATITGNVKLSDRDMDLATGLLTYDMRSRTAVYTGGGTITSRKEANTLTSERGTYLAGLRKFIFSGDVVLTGPDRSITSDTLHYTTTSGIAEFFGPTTIVSGDTRMWCRRGTYDTRNDVAHFTRRAMVLKEGRELHGDSLHYAKATGIGEAYGNVMVLDTANGMVVLGARGRNDARADGSWVTGGAEMRMRMGTDTLFLHGDTLVAAPDRGGRRITALHGVRFFKSDLQGVCDTMIYSEVDSMIHLLHAPALWSGDDQITGRTIRITMRDGRAHRLFVDRDAFLCSQVDSIRFDQVTGTSMNGRFNAEALEELIAEGNCRTVYFAREEATDSLGTMRLIGLNRVDCSRIRVELRDGEADVITFLTKPSGTMYPVEQAPLDEMILRGFNWRGAQRPVDRAAIFDR